MEVEISLEILEIRYKTRRCLKAEKGNLNSNCRENLKSQFPYLAEHKHGLIATTQGNVGATN
jgi:hypothetical protein